MVERNIWSEPGSNLWSAHLILSELLIFLNFQSTDMCTSLIYCSTSSCGWRAGIFISRLSALDTSRLMQRTDDADSERCGFLIVYDPV